MIGLHKLNYTVDQNSNLQLNVVNFATQPKNRDSYFMTIPKNLLD
jgi:hypothetical protein